MLVRATPLAGSTKLSISTSSKTKKGSESLPALKTSVDEGVVPASIICATLIEGTATADSVVLGAAIPPAAETRKRATGVSTLKGALAAVALAASSSLTLKGVETAEASISTKAPETVARVTREPGCTTTSMALIARAEN